MTENKRFTKVEHIFELNDEGIKDNQTRIEYYYALDLIDLLNELSEENNKLRKELGSFEQVSFTDLCNGSRTVLYMKKEKGDSE